jgi:ABC-2 type transport system permease protein
MITDILTIAAKELRELLFQRGRFRGGWIGLLFFIGVFGVFMPLNSGRDWIESPVGLVYWAWIPYLMVSSVVADSFAGERERHTLETLLATRLSDRAILFGKLISAVVYGWGLTMICLLLSLVTINVAYYGEELLLYPLDIGAGILTLSLLVSGLAAGMGVLISLRASTVRQAQQTFSITFFALFIPFFAIQFLPEEWRMRLMQMVMQLNVSQALLAGVLVLLGLDIALIAAAMARFQRNRLILD